MQKKMLLNNAIQTNNEMFCIDFTDSTVDGSVTISSNTIPILTYSLNDPVNFVDIVSKGQLISVPKGSKLYIKSTQVVDSLFTYSDYDYEDNPWKIEGNNVKLSGNINWLLGDPNIEILGDYAFGYMFENVKSIVNASALHLPATTLANSCYNSMFYNCTSLTQAPELPATTLANYCYQYMFYRCTKLNYIKCLAIDISEYNCTAEWAYGVSSTGTFVKHPSMNSWPTGSSGIPSGWTVQNA